MTSPTIRNFGPFTNGLVDPNVAIVDATTQSKDLIACENFDFDSRGMLKARPGINLFYGTGSISQAVGKAIGSFSALGVIGSYTPWGGVFGIGTLGHGDYIKTGTYATVGVEYAGNFFVPADAGWGSPGNGGYIDSSAIWHDDLNMPKGYDIIAFGQRLFVLGYNSTVWYSDPINPAAPVPVSWPATNFFTVGYKDGEAVLNIEAYNGSLLIFKRTSTWVFDYDADPAAGSLQLLNDEIGSIQQDCTCVYENSVYVLSLQGLYEITNYTFTNVSTLFAPFDVSTYRQTKPVANSGTNLLPGYNTTMYLQSWDNSIRNSICAVGDRILVRTNKYLAVFYPKIGAWSVWTSPDPRTTYIGVLYRNTAVTDGRYEGGGMIEITNGTNDYSLYAVIWDGPQAYTHPEQVVDRSIAGQTTTIVTGFSCFLKTPYYDLDAPMEYKKLLHWGIVVLGTYSIDVTQISGVAQQVSGPRNYSTGQIVPGVAGNDTHSVRFSGGVRFNQISFEVTLKAGVANEFKAVSFSYLFGVLGNKAITETVVN